MSAWRLFSKSECSIGLSGQPKICVVATFFYFSHLVADGLRHILRTRCCVEPTCCGSQTGLTMGLSRRSHLLEKAVDIVMVPGTEGTKITDSRGMALREDLTILLETLHVLNSYSGTQVSLEIK